MVLGEDAISWDISVQADGAAGDTYDIVQGVFAVLLSQSPGDAFVIQVLWCRMQALFYFFATSWLHAATVGYDH